MKKIGLVIIILLIIISFISCEKYENVVYVYNWGDYIDETILDDFYNETEIKVIYDWYDSNETMYTKLKNGGSIYDIVIPSDYMVERMIKENMVQKLDMSKLDNYKNIAPEYLNASFDPNDEYSVPYFVGTNGLLYNKKMVDDEVDSWNILWDEKYKGKILMNNSHRDSIMVALKLLGYSMNTVDPDELNEAKELLLEQSELVMGYVIDNGKDLMVNNEAAFLVTWNGDAITMINENKDLNYIIPKEGANIWIDSMVIPKDSQNVENAYKFIDYLLKPEVGLKNSDYVGYSTPNMETIKLLDDEIKNNNIAYPDLSKLKNMETFIDLGEDIKLYDDIWIEVTSN